MGKRLAFKFYRSYYDVLEDIDRDEDKLAYLLALLDKQFNGVEPSLKGISKIVYNGQKYSIDKQVEGWENKQRVKLSPTEDPTLPPTLPPTKGGSQGGLVGGWGHPNQGGSEDPYLQEQEQEQEQEKEEEVVQGNLDFTIKTLVQPSEFDIELFDIMFKSFNEPDTSFDELFDLWWKLPKEEQDDSIDYYTKYIYWCKENKKPLRLYYYLNDKKYNWSSLRK